MILSRRAPQFQLFIQWDIPIRPACSLFKAPNASSLSNSFIPVIGSSCVESSQFQQ